MHRYSPYATFTSQPIQNNELEKNLKEWIQIAKTRPNELEQQVMKQIPYKNANYTTQVAAVEWNLDLYGTNTSTHSVATNQTNFSSSSSSKSKGVYSQSSRQPNSSHGAPNQMSQSRTAEEEEYLQQMKKRQQRKFR